jgi:uncharacterized protein (TIGR02147 family)
MKQKPEVFTYHDYRQYLNDLFAHLKAQRKGFSVAALSRATQVSKGYFSMVLSGKCEMTQNVLERVLPHLKLLPKEENCLRYLCALVWARSQDEKIRILEQLQKLRSYREVNPKEAEVYQYLTHWYYVAIREMAYLPDFRLEATWIQKRLWEPVPLSDIEKAIEFLIRHGFLELRPDGTVEQPVKRLDCLDQIHKAALMQFYRQMFGLAINTVDKVEMSQKKMEGLTVAISEKRFAEIRTLLDQTLDKIEKMVEADKERDAVFQITLMGFPLTRTKGAKSA